MGELGTKSKEKALKLPIKNLIVLVAVVGIVQCGNSPSWGFFDGSVSKNNFYDTKNTIMPELTPETDLKTGKYWEKNLFYLNKYRPIFMLSNKELYNLMPEKKVSVFQRVTTPSVYNISLKQSAVKKITISPIPKKIDTTNEAKASPWATPQFAKTPAAKTSSFEQNQIAKANFLFEQAKNQGVDTDKKIDTALILKETKTAQNYALALDLLDDVTREEPYNAIAYNIKAEIYLEKNDTKSAMENYIEVLKLNPYSKESCLGIAKILEPTNKPLAQKYYDRAKL